MISVEREEAALAAIRSGESDRAIARSQRISRGTVALLRRHGRRQRGTPPAEEALPIVGPHRCETCGATIVHAECVCCTTPAPPALPLADDPPANFSSQLHGETLAKQQDILCQKCHCDPRQFSAAVHGELVECPLQRPPAECPAGRQRLGCDSPIADREDAA